MGAEGVLVFWYEGPRYPQCLLLSPDSSTLSRAPPTKMSPALSLWGLEALTNVRTNVADLCRGSKGAPTVCLFKGPCAATSGAPSEGLVKSSEHTRLCGELSRKDGGLHGSPRTRNSSVPFHLFSCIECGRHLGATAFVAVGAPEVSLMRHCPYGGSLFSVDVQAGDMLLLL